MCGDNATTEAMLVAALAALKKGGKKQRRRGPSKADREKAERTLLGEEYMPGQRKVLPEHRPYGPLGDSPPNTLIAWGG